MRSTCPQTHMQGSLKCARLSRRSCWCQLTWGGGGLHSTYRAWPSSYDVKTQRSALTQKDSGHTFSLTFLRTDRGQRRDAGQRDGRPAGRTGSSGRGGIQQEQQWSSSATDGRWLVQGYDKEQGKRRKMGKKVQQQQIWLKERISHRVTDVFMSKSQFWP